MSDAEIPPLGDDVDALRREMSPSERNLHSALVAGTRAALSRLIVGKEGASPEALEVLAEHEAAEAVRPFVRKVAGSSLMENHLTQALARQAIVVSRQHWVQGFVRVKGALN